MPDIWMMDSEFCCECGCILDFSETNICWFCLQNERYNEDQDYYDGWGSDWDISIEEVNKP